MSDSDVVTKEFLAQEFDRQFEKFAMLMKGSFDELHEELTEFKLEMHEFKNEMYEFRDETRTELRAAKADMQDVKSDISHLIERSDNTAGFAKELDDHRTRIAQNEKDIVLLKATSGIDIDKKLFYVTLCTYVQV